MFPCSSFPCGYGKEKHPKRNIDFVASFESIRPGRNNKNHCAAKGGTQKGIGQKTLVDLV